MYLEELLIEGFKSYVSRTQITGWDPEFNAITGLNGTGKSNILDAICFVLGITNLSQVRASNLQDLIYKRGQAGVTKASVTIVFNNENREKSPLGFEAYKQITVTRQVLMGGRTKYIVNGHNAQQQTVQSLFQSVQLNINNPHFLIMQGRITKVLNMKPVEILNMVEEAAGTKMFEDRKAKASAIMGKKERKVEEIDKRLLEDIIPKLDRLREEKRIYQEFQKNETEMEMLNRLVISYEYKKHDERLNRSDTDNTDRISKLEECKTMQNTVKKEIDKINEAEKILSDSLKANSPGGKKIEALETQIKKYSSKKVQLSTKNKLVGSSITDEQQALATLASQKGGMNQSLSDQKRAYEKINEEYETFKTTYDEKTEEMKRTDELLQALTTGVSAEEGKENGYMEQLQQSKNMANQASTSEEQASLKIKHLHKELSEKEPQAAKALAESQGSVVALEKKKAEIKELEAQLGVLNWNPEIENGLLSRKRKEQDIINELYDKQESLSRKLSSLDFQYTNPTHDFDRSKVKGLVAELIHLDQDKFDASTALEICAGGKLYNVVVENEKVGGQLLDKGKLRRRWTLIPLNKIQGKKISHHKIAKAEKIAPGKVNLALSLIGYEDEVHEAMEWIFGGTFICDDAQSAKNITFNKEIFTKSVTLDGDVYDPHGTLSGGSKPNASGILIKVQELNEVRADIKHHTQLLQDLEKEIESSQKSIAEYKKCKQRLDLQSHEFSLLEQRMGKKQEEVKKQASLSKEKAFRECKRIEEEMTDFHDNKDTKLDEMTLRVEKLKKELKKSSSKLKEMQRAVQTFELGIEQQKSDIDECDNKMNEVRESIDKYKSDAAEITKELEEILLFITESNKELEEERTIMNAQNEEHTELCEFLERKKKELANLGLEIQKMTHENDRFQKERLTSQQIVQDMEKRYDWIADEKQFFGEPGSAYDHQNMNLADAKTELKKLVQKHDSMQKALKGMLATVQKDKKKIEETIRTLENYKMEALEKTFHKVNKDFSEIFGDLLDGNTCKLQALEGKSISEGLEVKVCLGGVWKQSLTELSGGQRSLIALSLILSLLQFKPAPMYILDEVDAALDLAHTQNIGSLLRTRFKGSQFLVVSLKDGMFNNANVLFKTRFRDGTSVVERTTPYRKESAEVANRKRARGGKENRGTAA
ncbi:hypothetical protein INT48_006316 [Thamnidium elegans]|uniref:SMC hinge domain-containing protein n=1 Tax=Thamnidium elegans TaxID=101142 RepID=A0A8H7SNR2_9FUNG|nr:hypothetical protein INT48_006316 [Thamnidium elegans]